MKRFSIGGSGAKTSSRAQMSSRSEAAPAVPTYRRNRTITDRSTVPEVSERARIHHLRALRRKIGLILFIVVCGIFLVIIGVSQFSSSVRISALGNTSLSKEIDEPVYQKLFDTYYSKHPFDRFRFLTDIKQLTVILQSEAPEVSAISSSAMESLGVSHYELVMRQPVASWVVEGKRYYVDAEGVTFTRNYYIEPKVSVVDNSGARVVQGSAIASSRLLSFVGRAVSLSLDKGIAITSIELPSESMRQLYLKGKGMPTVKMTIDRAVEMQVNDMTKALQYFKQKKETPRYIDVRASGRVFYK